MTWSKKYARHADFAELLENSCLIKLLSLIELLEKLGIQSSTIIKLPGVISIGPSNTLVNYIHRQIKSSNDRYRNGE